MLLAILLSALLLLASISVHYLALRTASDLIERWECPCYPALTLSVTAITLAHVVEASLFAGGFWLGDRTLGLGSFEGAGAMGWMDYFYFSLVNFTTLGRGDLTPTGHLRLIAGIEAFGGFLLITASGAFILQVMAGKAPLKRG